MVLLVTTYVAYCGLIALLGMRLGFFLGMLFSWLVWCLAFPLWAVGPGELRAAFRRVSPRVGPRPWFGWVLLAIPVIMALAVGYTEVWPQATPAIILASIPFALANRTFEAVLWRGTCARAFPEHLILGYLYPAFGFAIWGRCWATRTAWASERGICPANEWQLDGQLQVIRWLSSAHGLAAPERSTCKRQPPSC